MRNGHGNVLTLGSHDPSVSLNGSEMPVLQVSQITNAINCMEDFNVSQAQDSSIVSAMLNKSLTVCMQAETSFLVVKPIEGLYDIIFDDIIPYSRVIREALINRSLAKITGCAYI